VCDCEFADVTQQHYAICLTDTGLPCSECTAVELMSLTQGMALILAARTDTHTTLHCIQATDAIP